MNMNAPFDKQETPAMARRRLAEYQRRSKIFNDTERTIGIDADALDNQVYNAHYEKALRDIEDKYNVDQLLRHDKLAVTAEKIHNEEVSLMNKKLAAFLIAEQKPEYSTEFEVTDPDFKKKDLPARICDDDPHCGVSCAQQMVGEDLDHKERAKRKQKQLCSWLEQQLAEKSLQKQKEKEEKLEWDLRIQQGDQHDRELQKIEEEYRKKLRDSLSIFNKNFAERSLTLKTDEELLDEMDRVQDIYNCCNGDFLTENPSVAVSTLDPCRILPNRWKGMSKDELSNYHRDLKKQIAENQCYKETEKREEEQVYLARQSRLREAMLHERKEQRDINRQNRELYLENCELAKIQKLRNEYFRKLYRAEDVSEKHYDQFKTNTR